MEKLNVIFMGTPEFGVEILDTLYEYTNVELVVSKKDAYVGRKKILTMSPVKERALEYGINVLTPDSLNEIKDVIIDLKPDLIVTCAYGKLVPEDILNIPKYKSINVHASLLPKYRGGAPIERAIMNGDTETGVTIMYMAKTMDSGDIILQSKVEILKTDTLKTLRDKLIDISKPALIDAINQIINGTQNIIVQDENLVTYAKIITKEDELIDFNSDAKSIYDKIRALNPKPYAYFILNNKIIKVVEANYTDKVSEAGLILDITKKYIEIGTNHGTIQLLKIKPEGKNEMLVSDYINGLNIKDLIGKKITS